MLENRALHDERCVTHYYIELVANRWRKEECEIRRLSPLILGEFVRKWTSELCESVFQVYYQPLQALRTICENANVKFFWGGIVEFI